MRLTLMGDAMIGQATRLFAFALTFHSVVVAHTVERALVHAKSMNHQALVVGVSHGLPGIGIDVGTVTKMAKHPDYEFNVSSLLDRPATASTILKLMTELSQKAADTGTFLFYFSGHGNKGIISVQDRILKASEMRRALEMGRQGLGPMERLVLIFDSCYSGSLLNPFRHLLVLHEADPLQANEEFIDELVTTFQRNTRSEAYWESLFIFASSRDNETSLASSSGGIFTNAMAKAFKEAMQENLVMKEFISRAQRYTEEHHPVARLSPLDLENEKMRL